VDRDGFWGGPAVTMGPKSEKQKNLAVKKKKKIRFGPLVKEQGLVPLQPLFWVHPWMWKNKIQIISTKNKKLQNLKYKEKTQIYS
jgi:hypothetical protein